MYWALTVISLAFLWLAHRLYVLTKIPVPELIKILNIDIPKSSKLSVDNITHNKVYLHWDLPLVEHKIVSFVLYVNGNQASTINGSVSHCCLSNLSPNSKYKIDLISINSNGYKAKNEPSFIKTKSEKLQNYPNSILLENPENLFRLLTDNPDVSTVHKLTTPSTLTPNGEGRTAGRSRSNTVNSMNGANTNGVGTSIPASYAASTITNNSFLPDPKSLDDIEELRYHLESGQEELHTILNQQSQAMRDFKEQELLLLEERDKLRDRKKLEDLNRQSIKTEMKLLDDSRRLTELKKSKHENFLIAKRKVIEKMELDLQNWNLKIDEFEKLKTDLNESENKIQNGLEQDITKKKERIEALQLAITKIDEEIKGVNSQKKQREQLKPQFAKVFKTLNDHTDQSGCIDGEAVKHLEQLKTLDPTIHQKVSKEIELDTRLEAEWRAQQQREVNNCMKISKSFDMIKLENSQLKSALNPSSSHGSTPPSVRSQPSTLIQQSSQAQNLLSTASGQQISQYLSQPQHQPTGNMSPPPSNANTAFPFSVQTGFNYNGLQNGSSPSLNSYQQLQQSQPQSTPSNFNSSTYGWNSFQISDNNPSGNSNGFSFNATVPNIGASNLNLQNEGELFGLDEPDIPSTETNAKHLLPKYLIDEDEYNKYVNDAHGPTTSTTTSASIIDNHLNHLQRPESYFQLLNTDNLIGSSANISTRSIFHTDFGLSPQGSGFPLDNSSPPPRSYNSDLANVKNNDLNSILSGEQQQQSVPNGILPKPVRPNTPSLSTKPSKENTNHLSSFSPRRLSNVFNFGRGKAIDESNNNERNEVHPVSAPSNTIPKTQHHQQSKFFSRNSGDHNKLNDIDSNNVGASTNNKLFPFNHDSSNQSTTPSSKYLLDSVWQSPSSNSISHDRKVSVNSSHSNNISFEKDQGFSKFFPAGSNADVMKEEDGFLSVNNNNDGSNVSITSEDHNSVHTGGPIHLSSTDKSSNTTSIKSMKSTNDTASNVSSSPSFFRKNKFLINPFGNNSNNTQNEAIGKSPSKQSSSLFRTLSPTKLDYHSLEDSDIEDYNPVPTGNANTPKRLFSRSRKSSSSNMRKQSVSSSHNDTDSNHNMTDGSIQSNHSNQGVNSANGKSLVKKFFGKGGKGEKESIGDIDELVEEEQS